MPNCQKKLILKKFVQDFIFAIRNLPNFSFIPVDSKLSNLASWIICKTALESSDALYVALAFDYNLELITLDKEQLEKAKILIKAKKP